MMARPMWWAMAAAVVIAAPALACDWHSADNTADPRASMVLAQATDQARPARGPQSEVSVPNVAAPATPTDTTAATDQPPIIKNMNESEKNKIEQTGK